MRLGGSKAWSLKPGREVELTELMIFNGNRPRVYVDGQFDKAFPSIPPKRQEKHGGGLNLGAGVDPVQLLRTAKPGNWHNAIRDFTAYCVGVGLPDWIIIEATRQVLDNPSDTSDVVELIHGARKKFDIPNPATEQAESAPLRHNTGSGIRYCRPFL